MATVEGAGVGSASAEFDRGRDAYLELMRRVPESVTGYLRPGDDYSLGGIAVHVNYALEHYRLVLEAMVAAGFAETRPQEPPELDRQAHERARGSLGPAELAAELARGERLHRQLLDTVAAIDDPDRKAPVWYSGGSEPFPTSARDVLGWLTDHYHEHVPQVEALITEAERAWGVVMRFNEAFARGDVDAVMALMTEDCVFENTYPPPDGERHVGQTDVRAFWETFFASTQNPRFETEEMFAAGDRVVGRWRFTWGDGPEPAGHVRGVDVFRVREGKVAEKLSYVKG
jgi:ketosteroid isomerase-like protein